MESMLEKFIEIYNLPKDSEFKRLKLEDAIIEKFGDIHYNRFINCLENNEPSKYMVGSDMKWGLYGISTDTYYNSTEEALLALFVKYGVEPEEGTEEYYVENFRDDFHEIVNEVYKC